MLQKISLLQIPSIFAASSRTSVLLMGVYWPSPAEMFFFTAVGDRCLSVYVSYSNLICPTKCLLQKQYRQRNILNQKSRAPLGPDFQSVALRASFGHFGPPFGPSGLFWVKTFHQQIHKNFVKKSKKIVNKSNKFVHKSKKIC